MNQEIKKQFDEMKAKHPDTLLLFRSGNFYEVLAEDAAVVADLLGIIVTDRRGEKIAAFPAHALDEYLPKLVRAGKRVAICDQPEDPKLTKKLVKRGITEEQSSTPQVKQFNSSKAMEVKNIPLSDIQPSPLNPRKTFDEEGIRDLADNIRQNGLLQPITIRPVEGKKTPYEIVCGERRYRAFCLNLEIRVKEPSVIPCIVRDMTDEEALDAMITENLQRQDVDPIEEAFAFGQLVKTGKTIEEIALRFGKSKRFIAERIKLDNLLPELKKMVTDGKLHIGAAMHVSKLTEDEQRQFLEWCDEQDEVSKADAIEFTDDLFMKIGKADWHKDFKGSCGTTCIECPYNNTNVGCLFYEMKPHDATCTNRARWDAKRFSWLRQLIDDNADTLVKEALEKGKTVVAVLANKYFLDRCKGYEELVQYVKDKGYKVVNFDDVFLRCSSYREDDERLQAKLESGEVYRTLVIETGYRGIEIHIRYCAFKKEPTGEATEEAKAMQLVNEYKENERKNSTNIASKLRGLLGGMEPTELPTEPLSQTESLILLTLILRKASYKFRDGIDLTATSSSEPKALNYARAHTDQVHQICRDFIREELSCAGVEYNTDLQECQSMLLQEWAKEQADEIKNELAVKLAKKQTKIEEQLTALGYKTDGTKMDF